MKRPNILLFMSDNQPADLLGCYGNDEVRTPNLDGLAARGVRFKNAFCVNAMCSPCRASVLTGLMPSQHGLHNWLDDSLMDQWPQNWSAISEFITIPTVLKAAGFRTALIGKYHLGVPFDPQLAFDHWVTFPHGHTISFFDNDMIDNEKRYRFAGHSVDFFTDKTVEFLEHQAGQDEPFFAFVPYNGPYGHWPAIKGRPDIPQADLYDDADMHSIPREGIASEVIKRLGLRIEHGGMREQFNGPVLLPNNVTALRNYFAQVSLIDDGVGRILRALERLHLDENTIVIYTADHGFSLGHNGIWGHGAAAFPASAHRASYHIPLIISGPDIAQGVVSDRFTSQIDLFPTVLGLAGQQDARPSLPSAARDLAPDLQVNGGDPAQCEDAVFYEQEETRAIRTRKWLYAMRFQGAPTYPLQDALFDLDNDPLEKTNLIDVPDYAEIIADLRDRVTEHFEIHSAPEYDLWNGGSAKSNVVFAPFWQDAWGPEWTPL